tara:strand:+ start:6197 stop:8494 length:2298 start_codon:yes stop_codon:yes gene_type:complete
MPKLKDVDRVHQIYELVSNYTRNQWEYVNQKGFDFSNDNQLSEQERIALEEQGMPTFTINRIMPVVEMLNFYATAQNPRWQAIAVEGSDVDTAAVFSDIADYIWDLSDGSSMYANCVNDSITKSIGYMMVDVDANSDNGMGDVVLKQPEPFDVYVDPKSRDILFKDAAFILIRKVLPKEHIKNMFPQYTSKIKAANSNINAEVNLTEKSTDAYQKDFSYKDIDEAESINGYTGENDELIEYFELYEKVRVAHINVFYRKPPDKKTISQIKKIVEAEIQQRQEEMAVELKETTLQMQQALQSGAMIQERYDLELKNLQQEMSGQIEQMYNQMFSKMIEDATVIENTIVSEKEFKILMKDKKFSDYVVDSVKFYAPRIRQITVVGDKKLSEKVLPQSITEYPIVPFHYKWTGTPYPVSAVSPLIGKQREINKSHQIMVHNASLGSSLRWMYEEGSVDTDYWERYASSPGALLPIRPGAAPPTPVQPAPLSNAFFTIVQEGKGDMEYLAGIYSSMQGDTQQQHETFRGMLALDEYGTRRIKQWLNNSLEPALRQLGRVVKQYSQAIYTAHKVFRIVQPNAIQDQKDVEINVPIYNDLGEAIGKFNDYSAAKFDVRIVSGSTLPVNRWAYIAELKELMQMGVIDDIALLAETDLKNKENIIKRKSLYSQLQGQVSSMEQQLKEQSGTIETLERQLVQAGIKGKVMAAEVEISKRKEQAKTGIAKDQLTTEAKHKLLQQSMAQNVDNANQRMGMEMDKVINDLQNSKTED